MQTERRFRWDAPHSAVADFCWLLKKVEVAVQRERAEALAAETRQPVAMRPVILR